MLKKLKQKMRKDTQNYYKKQICEKYKKDKDKKKI